MLKKLDENELPSWKKSELREKIGALQNKQRQSAKTDLASLQKLVSSFSDEVISSLKEKPSPFFVSSLEVNDSTSLLNEAIKKIHESVPDVALLLLSPDKAKNKVSVVARVPPSSPLKNTLKANEWVSESVRVLGGKGGGKPDTAQGSAQGAERMEEVENKAKEFITQKLSS